MVQKRRYRQIKLTETDMTWNEWNIDRTEPINRVIRSDWLIDHQNSHLFCKYKLYYTQPNAFHWTKYWLKCYKQREKKFILNFKKLNSTVIAHCMLHSLVCNTCYASFRYENIKYTIDKLAIVGVFFLSNKENKKIWAPVWQSLRRNWRYGWTKKNKIFCRYQKWPGLY